MYIKLTGAIIIIVSSVVFAIDTINKMQQKEDTVHEWKSFFEILGTVLASGRADIVQAMQTAANGKSDNIADSVNTFCDTLQQGNTTGFYDAWSEYVKSCDSPPVGKTRNIIDEFASNISNIDVSICIKAATVAADKLKEYESNLKISNKNNKKLVVCSAISGGLFVVILLI